MNTMECTLSTLKEDCKTIEQEFLLRLKNTDDSVPVMDIKPESGRKITLAQIVRINKLEKVSKVLRQAVGMTEYIITHQQLLPSDGDILKEFTNDVQQIGQSLHTFCMDHLVDTSEQTCSETNLPDHLIETSELLSSKPNSIDHLARTSNLKIVSSKGDEHDEYKEISENHTSESCDIITGSTTLNNNEKNTTESFEIKIKGTSGMNEFQNKKLSLLKCLNLILDGHSIPKELVNNNHRYSQPTSRNSVVEAKSNHGSCKATGIPKQRPLAEKLDRATVEKYVQKLNDMVETLLKALKKCMSHQEGKDCPKVKIERSYSEDFAGVNMGANDKLLPLAWQKGNNRQSPFKRSLSFRERNTVQFHFQQNSLVVSAAHVEVLMAQLPLKYKTKVM